MAIPIIYNVRSVKARWTSAIVAVLGIAGTVGVFVAMLSLARGFKATLVASGSDDNAIIMRAGATSEMISGISLDQIKIMQDSPASPADGSPLVTSEVVVIAPFPLRSTGTDANVQVRGVSPHALNVRKNIKIIEGRMFQPGLAELIVGRNVARPTPASAWATPSNLAADTGRSWASSTPAAALRFRSLVRCARARRCLQAPRQYLSVRHRPSDSPASPSNSKIRSQPIPV